ncbi:hypothetical protein SCE1572_31030 [Sorangium cellulosum So0157-2]|uniref:Uncharacterized protein n=1 Tax=Sorangium cellulosum So0157-2 TaxID=1254432 RepID=S4Y2Y1_SORCE|nr:hypothetical protein [Sorangium cellulosum]AGP38520.1 hypothetical protein SCE1572_31030 [Sorangium cellulosum So0157-2]
MPSAEASFATNGARCGGLAAVRPTAMFQYSSGTNASTSRSRSTMRRSATDCTRPADRPNASFDHTSAETS